MYTVPVVFCINTEHYGRAITGSASKRSIPALRSGTASLPSKSLTGQKKQNFWSKLLINTFNETHLHRTLKNLYAMNYNGKTEVEKFSHIYDILTEDGNAIEIQTQSLSKLYPKAVDSIEKGMKFRIVFTIAVTKTIETISEDGKILSRRKSPKKGSIYSLFRELTGIYPILLNNAFTLEVLLINSTEVRTRQEKEVQSKNRKRRFKKDWLKTDKRLEEINETLIFNKAEDYLALLPKELPAEFTAKDLSAALKKEKKPSSAYTNAHLMIWVLSRMNLLEHTGKQGKSNKYRINGQFVNPEQYGKFCGKKS